MMILDASISLDELKAKMEKRNTLFSWTKIYYPYWIFYYKVIYERKFLQPKTYPFIVAIECLTEYPFLLRKGPELVEDDLEGKVILDSFVSREKAESLALNFVKDSVHLKGGINAVPKYELFKCLDFYKCNYLISCQSDGKNQNLLMDGKTGCIGVIGKEEPVPISAVEC